MPNSDHSSGRANSRSRILDAAAALVAEQGVQHLTIEAAAAASGITKGGLIYHFKTRDELLAALVARMVEELDTNKHLPSTAGEPLSPKTRLLGLVELSFNMPDSQRRLLANMLAAASAHPQLLPPVQSLFAGVYDELASGPQAGLALLLAAAIDGMDLLELTQLHRFTSAQRDAMRQTLLKLVHQLP